MRRRDEDRVIAAVERKVAEAYRAGYRMGYASATQASITPMRPPSLAPRDALGGVSEGRDAPGQAENGET